MTTPASDNGAGRGEERLLEHLRRAGELIGARRLPEAELEILKGLGSSSQDLRALKLLALLRFKLGRLAEARETYRKAVHVAPDDAAAHLGLGLVALKLEWFEDAIVELSHATRLRGDDTRAQCYLGYAYARSGALAQAAEAFRRAGQPEVAAEIDSHGDPKRIHIPPRDEIRRAEIAHTSGQPASDGAPAAAAAPADAGNAPPLPVTGFALSRLLPQGPAPSVSPPAGPGTRRFEVREEAHVRRAALLASEGQLRFEPARRRRRGRLTEETLGRDADGFVRCVGAGALWLVRPSESRGILALALDQDVLYVREERVVAFDGEVVWESGNLPWDTAALLQFRGSGQIVLDASDDEIVALRVPEGETITVPAPRLLGWLGRVVARSVPEGSDSVLSGIACEGEGMLLLCRHGDLARPVHEPPQPRHDGEGAAGPGRPHLHR